MDELLKKLKEYKPNDLVFNQYSNLDSTGNIRLNNLKLYIQSINPEMILIGEAPGYHGCRWSGIPFTSEYIMLKSEIHIFKENKFKQSSQGKLKKERSATIVWDTIKNFSPLPFLWNIYPFYPHESGNQKDMRRPTTKEVEDGINFLKMIINIYPKAILVGVGEVAQKKLESLGIKYEEVRHPSFGGKKLFRDQLLKLINH
tara:strand:- start:224 stop:826 length:603 start_codon:yes stop_codon:yes gene_type:complete